jgi:hypothetical protein
MRILLLVALLSVLGCATPPKPKAPDESQRTPVNKSVPAELRGARPPPEVRP